MWPPNDMTWSDLPSWRHDDMETNGAPAEEPNSPEQLFDSFLYDGKF